MPESVRSRPRRAAGPPQAAAPRRRRASLERRVQALTRRNAALARRVDALSRRNAALQAREVRTRALWSGGFEGVVIHDRGRVVEVNPAYARLFGYAPREMVGRSVYGNLDPSARAAAQQRIGRGGRVHTTIAARRKDGARIELEFHARPIRLGGRTLRLVAVRDVTEHAKREAQLREQQRLLQAVVDTIPHAVFVKDAAGRYRLVNRAMCELWATPQEGFIGRTTRQVRAIPRRMAWAIARLDRHVLRSGEPVDLPAIPVERPGESGTYRVTRFPLRDERGAVTGLVSLSENVTAKREAEERLRDSEQRFRTLVEGSVQGIAVYRGRRAVFANQAYARIAGYRSPEEILALDSFARITHAEDVERVQAFMLRAARGGPRDPAIEFRGVRKDARVVWVNLVVSPVTWGGLPCLLVAMLDVTERHEAAARLATSEERFRQLIEGSIQGIMIHRDFRPLFANRALAEIHGYGSAEKILALPSLLALHPADRHGEAKARHRARMQGEPAPVRYERPGLRKDGRVIWLESLARMVTWEGEPAVQYTLIDVTERKRGEEAVRASQRLLQTMLDAIPLCIFTKDRAGRIVFANRAQSAFDGVAPEKLLGLATQDYPNRTPEQTAQNLDWDRRVIQHSERVEIPAYVRQDAQGRSRWLRGLRLPLQDERGAVVGQLGLNEDISEQREAEQALRQSEERYRTLVEGSIQGILIQRNFRILFVNRRLSAMHGYGSPEEVLTLHSSLELLSPAERERTEEMYRQYRQGGRSAQRMEVQALRKDGTPFWRENVLREVVWDDGLPAIQVTTQDITERKAAELQREALMADLRRANDDLRDFAYIVSHDLKAPLRGINSLAEWLAEDSAGELNAEGREHLGLLRQRTRRMSALLEGILTYSRIGSLPAAPAAVDAGAVVREVIDTLGPPPQVRVRVDGALPTVVYDPAQLTQVFQNLVGNAIQHLGRTQGEVCISAQREDGSWRFLIADDGVGIDPRNFDRIFKIFQQLKGPTEGGGTGIGLSVVKKIVENAGGTVRVESEPGRGSVFSFTVREAQE